VVDGKVGTLGGSYTAKNQLKTADQTIYHDRDHPSHLVLPVVPAKP
jgi:predicted acyl esterase